MVGTGPGYQFWDDELGAFSLGSLLNRTDYEYRDGSKDNFYSVAMKWDYNRYLIGKKVEFFTNGEVGKPLVRRGQLCAGCGNGLALQGHRLGIAQPQGRA